MQAIFDALKAVYDFIAGFPEWVIQVLLKVVTSFLLMLKDLVCWILDQLFSLALAAMNAFDFSEITQHATSFGSLPGEVINILGLIGIGEALGIIAAALVIRMALQLIPFVRLGS